MIKMFALYDVKDVAIYKITMLIFAWQGLSLSILV